MTPNEDFCEDCGEPKPLCTCDEPFQRVLQTTEGPKGDNDERQTVSESNVRPSLL